MNIHANDIMKCVEEKKEYLVLGLLWQIIKIQLLSTVNLKETPELVVLLEEDEVGFCFTCLVPDVHWHSS